MEKMKSFAKKKKVKFLDIFQHPMILYDKMGKFHQKLAIS